MADWTPARLDRAGFIVPMTAFICLNLTIIVGNMMVIMAVFTHSKLRSMTTNKFIVSLAFADLMVGVVVLPFSSSNEVCHVTYRSPSVSLLTSITWQRRLHHINVGANAPWKKYNNLLYWHSWV